MSEPTFQIVLGDLQAASAFCDDDRHLIDGVHLTVHGERAVLVATDGKTMIVLSVGEAKDLPPEMIGITFRVHSMLKTLTQNQPNFPCDLNLSIEGEHLRVDQEGLMHLEMRQPFLRGFPNWLKCIPTHGTVPLDHFALNLDYLERVRAAMLRLVHTAQLAPQVAVYQAAANPDETHPAAPLLVRPLNGPLEGRAVILIMPVDLASWHVQGPFPPWFHPLTPATDHDH